jgi:hypothetical protein
MILIYHVLNHLISVKAQLRNRHVRLLSLCKKVNTEETLNQHGRIVRCLLTTRFTLTIKSEDRSNLKQEAIDLEYAYSISIYIQSPNEHLLAFDANESPSS